METEKEVGSPFPSLDKQLGKFPDRLRYAIGSMSIRNIAESAGVSDGTIHNLLNGGLPNLKNAASIADALKVRLEWLTYGEGPINKMPSDPVHGSFMKAIQNSESNPHPDEYAYVPLYNIEASAGHGSYVENEEVASHLAFRRDWLHQEVHANPAHLHLIYVRGDSMEPALQSGEVVMVDTSAADESFRDGIYVIQVDSAVLVKRLQRLPGNRVRVMSNNAAYPSFEADLNNAEIKIIGRVIWHAGRI